MTITATIVADSTSSAGVRLTTMQLRYPRFVHAEFMTHRVFSRSSSSSRAIPVERLIADVERDPAMPTFWGKNQAGMQAREELSGDALKVVKLNWSSACKEAIYRAQVLASWDAHKQIVNRLIEPFSHINVVITATEWDNFFALRCHPDAKPEMRALAEAMRDARDASTPIILKSGDWHIPYVGPGYWDGPRDEGEGANWSDHLADLVRLSVARCARVSYLTHDGKEPSVEADLALYDRLASAVPMHASPMEHQATPDTFELRYDWKRNRLPTAGEVTTKWGEDWRQVEMWRYPDQHGNFVGWRQFRKIIESEGRSSG